MQCRRERWARYKERKLEERKLNDHIEHAALQWWIYNMSEIDKIVVGKWS